MNHISQVSTKYGYTFDFWEVQNKNGHYVLIDNMYSDINTYYCVFEFYDDTIFDKPIDHKVTIENYGITGIRIHGKCYKKPFKVGIIRDKELIYKGTISWS